MKKMVKYIVLAVATMFAVGCTPDYPTLDESQLPLASELEVEMDVNVNTNVVTLTLKNPGMVPVWAVTETLKDKDGNPALDNEGNVKTKVYRSSANPFSQRYNNSGTYAVEVKAYNSNGMSEGSIMKEFTLVNDFKIVMMLAGDGADGKVWVMDSATPGHLGCGESVTNAAGWWSAGPEEKAGTGLYDDEVTFYADGTYKYDPGKDGKMYINWGVTAIGPNPGAEPDIDIEWSVTESTYEFDGKTLTLAPQTPLIYVPSDVVWNTPLFHVIELTNSTMTLVAENPGCYWQYKLRARDVKGEEIFVNGENITNAAVSFDLAQNEEIEVTGVALDNMWIDPDFFVKTDATHLKFLAVDGNYRIAYMKDGKWLRVTPLESGDKATYENGKALWMIGDGGGKPEGEANIIGWGEGDAPLPFARISENEYRITLWMKAEGGSVKVFGQSGWGTEWTKDKYGTINGNGLFFISDGNVEGQDNGNIYTDASNQKNAGFYTFHITDNNGILDLEVEKLEKPAATQWDPEADCNMWKSTTITNEFYYATTDSWTPVENMGFVADGNHYTINLHTATVARWQAQVKYHTDMSSSADKFYDFQVKMVATKDHPAVMVKLTQDGDDNNFYCADESRGLVANEEFVFRLENVPGKDMPKIMLVLDFGLCAEGTEVEVYDIIFQEHTVVSE